MNFSSCANPFRAVLVAGGIGALLLAALATSCAPGGDNGNDNGAGQPAPSLPPVVTIISPTLDRNIAQGSIITITYTATNSPTDVVAFYDVDGIASNADDGLIADGLQGGTNQTVDFDTSVVGTGIYNIAIRASNAFGTTTQYARVGDELVTITVNGRPQAAINSPSSDIEVLFATTSTVDVVFSCNDPENQVSWQTFYDSNRIVDGTETTIATGAGNADPDSSNTRVGWLTLGVAEGTYEIGLTCTDSAGSTQTVYGNGQVIITSELSLPTITVSMPAVDLVVFADEQVVVNFASSDPAAAGTTITVFLDSNNQLGLDDTEFNLAVGLLPSATTVTVSSSIIPNGVYFVGAYIQRGSQQNVDYAPGKLTVIGVGDLTIAQPTEQVAVKPGTPVTIGWNTNIPSGLGLIDLALFSSDSSGAKGAPVTPDPLAEAKDLEVKPASFTLETDSLASGFYVVEVTLTPVDENDMPTGAPSSALTAPIRVTTLASIFWVGRIELSEDEQEAAPQGHFDGVVFEGINFEDNAGSSLLGGPELDALPLGGAFLIGSRFAKPFFSNPSGIGMGEAYLIYNQIATVNRRYSLNSVGSKSSAGDPDPNALAGLRFAGIAYDPSSEDIDENGEISLLSEDVDGNGSLDRFNEDLDFDGSVSDGLGSTIEDLDLDGFPDLAEDGWVGIDANGDGQIDDSSQRFFIDQFVNGALDVNVSEDRDADGKLDEPGDATWGLTNFALLPDVDGDTLPELAFGFQSTDSLSSDFRSELLGFVETPGFGDLTQPNQFERGGLVMVPSADQDIGFGEATISDPYQVGSEEDRVVHCDFVGQRFDEIPADAEEDDELEDLTGIFPPDDTDSETSGGSHGQDVVRFASDEFGVPVAFCTGDVLLGFVNNLAVDYAARARFIVTRIPAMGEPEMVELIAGPRSAAFACIEVMMDETIRIDADFQNGPVDLINPDSDNLPALGTFVDASGMGPFGPASVGAALYGVTGDSFFAVARNYEVPGPFIPFPSTCEIGGTDGCFETLVGPFYGFHYADVFPMESPTHPLAYAETFANPLVQFSALDVECPTCWRVLPPGTVSTGYYPGQAGEPFGARILGQRARDRFGASISRSRGTDDRVYVGAPRRPAGNQADAGAVYQFRMRRFWNSAPDLAGINGEHDDPMLDFDPLFGREAPKPHQYIIEEVGSERPNGLYGALRSSMADAIVYSGADAEDRLGEAVVGITDFNNDSRPDILMGAAGADGKNDAAPDSGAVYVIYRLPPAIENSVSLDKIELPPDNVNRLNGLLINGDAGDQLGVILAGNCDLNDDDENDIVIGNPLHGANDSGEVIVLLSGPNLASPEGGYSIQELVTQQRAIRIQGIAAGDQAGFAVACEGDFDGDGNDDLVISAPSATPMFDSNGDDVLDMPGLDLDRDGVNDGLISNPTDAGLVYVITNSDSLTPGTYNLSQMGGALQGFIFVGRKGGDNMGGGVEAKRMTRSQGLAYGGDVNGDGRSDLLVSSILADPLTGSGVPKTNAGEVYLIFGITAQQAEDILNPN